MLKATICCLLIAATAAMAWEELDSVQAPAEVRVGTKLTWGYGLVWGLFPVSEDEETYVHYYDPDWPGWYTGIDPIGEYLMHTGLTFQWKEQPVLFAVGEDTSTATTSLYWYTVYADDWWDEEIDPDTFVLDDGACIAYVPNESYHIWSHPVPGWIHCLPGGGESFWRYPIPADSLPDIALYGYYPGPGAVIADQTPPFMWGTVATPTYRLLVSTQSDFSDTVIDEQVSSPEYEPPTKLSNGGHYWRTATWISSAWSWSGDRNFVLAGGWEQLDSIPTPVGEGAAMAYDADRLGHPALLVLVGDGERDFYEYNLQQQDWNALTSAPGAVTEDAGTSITTSEPVIGWWYAYPMVAFGSEGADDNPYYYHPGGGTWHEWVQDSADPYYDSHFIESIKADASMIYGDSNNMFLVVGEENFYWVDPPSYIMDGGQAGATRTGIAQTQVIARSDGVEVEYQLPTSAYVRATLHDALGRRVGVLDAGQQQSGVHRLSWDRDGEGRKLSAGAYFVLLDMGTEQARLKAVVR